MNMTRDVENAARAARTTPALIITAGLALAACLADSARSDVPSTLTPISGSPYLGSGSPIALRPPPSPPPGRAMPCGP